MYVAASMLMSALLLLMLFGSMYICFVHVCVCVCVLELLVNIWWPALGTHTHTACYGG